MKYWHKRGNKDDLRCSLVSMLILYETWFNPWIVSVRVTKLPTTFFMFTKVPSTYLDQWLALSTNFPREYTCSRTISQKSAHRRSLLLTFSFTSSTDALRKTMVTRDLTAGCTDIFFFSFREAYLQVMMYSSFSKSLPKESALLNKRRFNKHVQNLFS